MSSSTYTPLTSQVSDTDHETYKSGSSRSYTTLILFGLLVLFLVLALLFAVLFGYTKAMEKNSSGSTVTNYTVNYTSPLFNLSAPSNPNNPNISLCVNIDCVKAAARISTYMDTSYDPCKDFYQFSCGGWDEMNDIPDGLDSWGTFDQLMMDNYGHMQKYLTEPINSSDPEAIKKMKWMYLACMDANTTENKAEMALLRYINVTGGWDKANMTQLEPWTFNNSLMLEHFYGSEAFFGIDIEPDDYNSSLAVIQISQSGLTLGIPDPYRNKSGDEFKQLIVLIGITLDGIANNPYGTAPDVANFEAKLAEIFLTDTELRNETLLYNPMSLANLSTIMPQMDWVEYFNFTFTEALGADGFVRFTEDDVVNVQTLDYFYNLSSILNETSTETLENYAKWQVVLHATNYLEESGAVTDILHKKRFPKSSRLTADFSFDCVEFVEGAMPFALARPFVEEFVPDTLRDKVNKTANLIENAFKERIMAKDWLDDTTKNRCVDKVNAITRQIAYPDFIKDDTALDSFYAELKVTEKSDYYDIGYANGLFQLQQVLKQYGKPVDKTQWLSAPTEVNAYYAPNFNQFVFLSGILRSPFIVSDWIESILLGGIGMVIGHELTHGFDDQGQQFDKYGDRVKWWTDGSIANFTKRTQCFVEQYSKYSLDGVEINGALTLGENIADNGGIHTAYQAYKDAGDNSTLPGLPFTSDQLYFISFAQLWCSKFTKEALEESTKTDPHSPGPIRVKGSLQNSEEFSEVFQCPKPDKPCELW